MSFDATAVQENVHANYLGTAYLNCEVRQFTFTPTSNEKDAHIVETEESRESRLNKSDVEKDPHVLSEMKDLEAV